MPAAFLSPAPIFLRRVARVPSRFLSARRASHVMSTPLPPVPLSPNIDVHIVRILSDNFSYLLHDKTAGTATVVDPAEPRRLTALAKALDATLTTALVTHHHWDHAGGNAELASLVPGIDIVGSAYETADAVTERLESGAKRGLSENLSVTALRTPCHTMGHLCFSTNTPVPAVFTGDTLFVGGCGKFFEGDAEDMDTSLNETLASLSPETLVFCGHEYTMTNLLFAKSVDQDNQHLADKLQWVKDKLASGGCSVPSTIGDEKLYNPFMRTSSPKLADALGLRNPSSVEVMKTLRERKNSYRP